MASRISATLGSGLRSSSQRAVIIIPGVQKPHCRPCSFMNAVCTGSSSPSCSRSSTVRISWPDAMAVSTVQLLTGSPSIQSTHVPQFDVSQPQWVPVRPRWSRTKCTRSRRGSTSRLTSSPLTVTVTCISGLLSARAGDGPAQCPLGELVDEMSLVVLGAALVGGRVALLTGETCRVDEAGLIRAAAGERRLRPRGPEMRSARGGEADPGLGDGLAFEREGRAGGDDGPVTDAPLDLLVRAARARAGR